MMIDCAAIKDKASSQQDQQGSSTNQSNQQGNEVLATENMPGSARKMVPVAVEESNEASAEIANAFGFDTLSGLQSKGWDDRAKAVELVRDRISQPPGNDTATKLFSAGIKVVQLLIGDRVMPVYLGALELARLLIVDFAPKQDLPQELVDSLLDTTIPLIVEKTSDRNSRSIEATHAAIMAMARALGPRHCMVHVVAPIAATTKETLAIRGRLELLEALIDEFGFSKSTGVSLSAVMGWVKPHLEAADEKIRHAAVEVTVSCYSHKGGRTTQYVSNLKPALLKVLEQRFAEVDQQGEKRKTKSDKKRNGSRKLAPLKGQHSQQRMTSRSSNRSTSSSSSGGRQSTSAGSTDSLSKRVLKAPLRGGNSSLAASSPTFPPHPLQSPMSSSNGANAMRSPMSQGVRMPDPMASPVAAQQEMETDQDMLDRADEEFMNQIQDLLD